MAPSHSTIEGIERTLSQIFIMSGHIDYKVLWAYRDYLVDKIRRIREERLSNELASAMRDADIFVLEGKLASLDIYMAFYEKMRDKKLMREKTKTLVNS